MSYGVVFFYGLYLVEEDIWTLLKRVGKFKPPPEVQVEAGFDSEEWYWEVRYWNEDDCEWIREIERFFKGPIALRITAVHDKESETRFCAAINETFHSKEESINPISLMILPEKWDQLLKIAYDELGLTWREPAFHLCFEYYSEYLHHSNYNGKFFYGIILDVPSVAHLVKYLLQRHPEIFRKMAEISEALIAEISPVEYQECQEACRRGDFQMEYELIETVFHSENFNRWVPSEKIIGKILYPELVDAWDSLWTDQHDPIYLGMNPKSSPNTPWSFAFYIAIRETHHTIRGVGCSKDFKLPSFNKEDWNRLLQKRCEQLRVAFTNPSFYILLDDTY